MLNEAAFHNSPFWGRRRGVGGTISEKTAAGKKGLL